MATTEEINTQANEVMHPHLATQAELARDLRKTEFRRARFMYLASVIIASIYAGFVTFRIVQERSFDVLTIIVLISMALSIASTRKRDASAKAALSDS